jgi:hypothetical protein
VLRSVETWVEKCIQAENKHFPNAYTESVHTSLAFMLIYFRYTFNVAKLIGNSIKLDLSIMYGRFYTI